MSSAHTTVTLTADDACELIDALEFIDDWLRRDHLRAGGSLFRLCAYDLADLRDDLARFVGLLGRPADRRDLNHVDGIES
jgi:hypothetical protein